MLGLKKLMNDETIVTIEVQYFLTLIRENLIDMIYHEHFYYHTIKSFERFSQRWILNYLTVRLLKLMVVA